MIVKFCDSAIIEILKFGYNKAYYKIMVSFTI
jgi:hypothetical protein